MRYISLVIIIALMAWSWSLIHNSKNLPESVHAVVQSDLERVIRGLVQQQLPQAQNLKFERMWTKVSKDNQLLANFIYSFEDQTKPDMAARIHLEGSAVLNHSTEANQDIWYLDEINIDNNHIEFTEGISIGPSGSDQE